MELYVCYGNTNYRGKVKLEILYDPKIKQLVCIELNPGPEYRLTSYKKWKQYKFISDE